jgi:hypothetical protein
MSPLIDRRAHAELVAWALQHEAFLRVTHGWRWGQIQSRTAADPRFRHTGGAYVSMSSASRIATVPTEGAA